MFVTAVVPFNIIIIVENLEIQSENQGTLSGV